ncbi:MAG: serine/threonine-protein kinase [Chloroflexota bacterium]
MITKQVNRRYNILRRLGSGGMGVVYLAEDRLSGETVALKQVQVPTERLNFLSRTPSLMTGDLRKSLTREFQTLGSLRHPHIISVLDFGFDEERRPFFTMTYLADAANLLAAGSPLPYPEKVRLIGQMFQALSYLHRREVLHRDLKPDNILVTDGHLRLLDFGLAVEQREGVEPSASSGGTLAYWAPEQWLGSSFYQETDLFSAGIIAYELLAGRHPFAPLDSFLLDRVLDREPDWQWIDGKPQMVNILKRLLAKEVADRYHSAEAVLADLNQLNTLEDVADLAGLRESFLQAAAFVGREPEMARLAEAQAKAAAGSGSLWLIGGESGVGKSRLLDEVRIAALVDGWLVISGQGRASHGSFYQLWQEILPQLVIRVALSDLEAGVLKALLPDISQLVERPISQPPALPGDGNQRRLRSTILSIIARQTQPTLLIIEDLQWVSDELDFLNEISKTIERQPFWLIASYRDDEAPDLALNLPNAQSLSLKRLDQDATAALSTAMLGKRVGDQPKLVSLLQKETEGNAFFLVEVVRALAEEAGRLTQIDAESLPAGVFTGGMQALVKRRLGKVAGRYQPLLVQSAIAAVSLISI